MSTAERLRDQADTIHTLHCEVSVTIGYHGPCDCGWPPVVLALADHMDAMARLDWVGSDAAMDEHLGARRKAIETYRALDAALNREPQT